MNGVRPHLLPFAKVDYFSAAFYLGYRSRATSERSRSVAAAARA